MSMSEAQKHDAYREAQHILRLDEKWQRLMPGERKPNFRRAAQVILKRALGHKTRRNEEPLDIHGGLMHEHGSREAALIERTLRSGIVHPDVLHSFQHGITKPDPDPVPAKGYDLGHDPDLPDFDVYIHDHGETIDYPSHYEPGADRYHSSIVHPPPPSREVQVKAPEGTRLPTTYEAVH